MMTPPISSAEPMTQKLSKLSEIFFFRSRAGTAVQTKAIMTRLTGWLKRLRSPRSPWGKVDGTDRRCAPRNKPAGRDRAELDDDGVHLPVAGLSPAWRLSSSSPMRRCAVELTGRNSVSPSMIPSTIESR